MRPICLVMAAVAIAAPSVTHAATVCWNSKSSVSPEDERKLKRAVKNAFDKATRTKPGVVNPNIGVEALCGIDFKIRYVYVHLGFYQKEPRHRVNILIDNVERFAVDDQFVSSATYDIQGKIKNFTFGTCAWESSFDCHGGGGFFLSPDLNPFPSGERKKAGTRITRFMSVFAGQLLATLNTNVRVRR
jgi:hypothetical protein